MLLIRTIYFSISTVCKCSLPEQGDYFLKICFNIFKTISFIYLYSLVCLNNIMNLQGVDSYLQQVVKGAIIVAAVLYDIKFKNKKSAKVILVNKEDKDKSN